jgi:hypothetical protein
MLPFLSQKVLNRNHIIVLSGSGGLADCISQMRMPTAEMLFKYDLITDADQTATAFVIEGEFGFLRLVPVKTDQLHKKYSATSSIFLGVLNKCLLLRSHVNADPDQWKNITVKDHYSLQNYEVDRYAPSTEGPIGIFKKDYRSRKLHFRIFISVNMSNAKDGKASFVDVELVNKLHDSLLSLAAISFKIQKSGIEFLKVKEGLVLEIKSSIGIERADSYPHSFVVDFDAVPLESAANFVLNNCMYVHVNCKDDALQECSEFSPIANIEEVHVHVRSEDFPNPDNHKQYLNKYLNSNLSVLRFLSRFQVPSAELHKIDSKKYIMLGLHSPDKNYILLGAQRLLCTDLAFQKMICELVSSQYIHIHSSMENDFDQSLNKINLRPPSLPISESSVLNRRNSNAFNYPKEFSGRHGLLGFDWTVSSKEPPVSSGNSPKCSSVFSEEPPSASVSSQQSQSFSRAFICIAENNKHDAETIIPLLLHNGISGDRLESVPWESCKKITPSIVFSFAESYASTEMYAPNDISIPEASLQTIFNGLLKSIPARVGAWMVSSCSSSYISDSLSLYLSAAKRWRSESYPNCGFFGLGYLENTLAALAKDFQSQEWYKSFEESIFKGSLNNNNLFLGIGVQTYQASKDPKDPNFRVPPLPSSIAGKSILAGPLDAMIFVCNSEKIDDISALFHGSANSSRRQDDYVLSSVVQFKCRFLSILRDKIQACHVCVAYIPASNGEIDRTELLNPHNTALINEVLFASRLNSGSSFCPLPA